MTSLQRFRKLLGGPSEQVWVTSFFTMYKATSKWNDSTIGISDISFILNIVFYYLFTFADLLTFAYLLLLTYLLTYSLLLTYLLTMSNDPFY